MDETRRGWRLGADGWWCCDVDRGDWSCMKLKFTERGEEETEGVHDPSDDSDLQLLDALQHVTAVSIHPSAVNRSSIMKLMKVLQTADDPVPSLESLKIVNCTMDKLEIRSVVDFIESGKVSRLKTLVLDGVGLYDADVEILAAAISSGCLPSLSHLMLQSNSFHSGGLRLLAFSLHCVKGLKYLDLGDNDVGIGHSGLAKALESVEMVALETLFLYHTGIGDSCCEAYEIALSSGKLPSLTNINFQQNNIGNRGAEALGRAIRSGKLTRLVVLDLGNNNIRDDGMIALAESFQVGVCSVLPKLGYLKFNGNPFGEVGLLSLTKALRSGRLDSLEVLNVRTRISSEKEAIALVAALSSNKYLTVKFDYEWRKFPALELRREQLIRRNFRNVDILAGLGGCPVVPASYGKVYLCGSPEVGKTTLRRTLQRSLWESLWTWESRPHVEKHTRGIDISQFSSQGNKPGENPLTLSVWDMAGQEDYHLVHNAFFPDLSFAEGKATTFVIVCTSENLEKSVRELEYWLRFIASSCDKIIQNLRHVFVVLNNIGGDTNVLRYTHHWKQVLDNQREKFAGYLEIRTDLFIVDVRRRRLVNNLKGCLIKHCRNVLRDEEVPLLCRFIQRDLGVWSKARKQFPVLHWTEFMNQVRRATREWPEKTVEAATKYLNEAGVLIYIDKEFPTDWGIPYRRLVVLDPNWFCREIVGNIFLPHDMVIPVERSFRMWVDRNVGSISVSDFKKFFKPLLGEWDDLEFEDLIAILLWLGLCYQGRDQNVFIPALIAENGTPGDRWNPHNLLEQHGKDQWVMGFSVEHKKSEIALSPISLWHRFQVELAQTPKFNGQVPDNDFVAHKYFTTFTVDYMDVLIEVNAEKASPTFDEISIFVKPLLKVDHLDGNERKQCQVDLANDLVEILLRLWNEVCPGVEYLHQVVWPWPASRPRPKVTPKRNVEVVEVMKWVQEHGLGRSMQWMVGFDTITEDQLLSRKDKDDVFESMQGSLFILRQGMREAVDLGIFPRDVLIEEVSYEESKTGSDEIEATSQPLSPTGKLVLHSVRSIHKKLDSIRDLAETNLMVTREVRNDVKEVLKRQKELHQKLQDLGEIFFQDRERTCPRFVYLGKKNSGTWMTLKQALSASVTIRLHFACEARYNDYRQHAVEDQLGLDVSGLKGWARTIVPWLKVSLTILFISAKIAANVVMPGLGMILPDFAQWQQASSLSEGLSLATGFSKEELDKHMVEGVGPGDSNADCSPRELYGKSRKAINELLGSLSPQEYEEKLGLRKVFLYYDDGSLHGMAWICNECYLKYRTSNISMRLVREI